MSDPHVWKKGDRVRLTFEGRTVPALVVLASHNSRSLMLAFEAILGPSLAGGYVGMMPVSWELEHGGPGYYADLIYGRLVRLEPPEDHGEG